MDVFSAMSASLTPLQVAHQLAKFATKVEGAHKKLLQYCDHLILVDHLLHTVNDLAMHVPESEKQIIAMCKAQVDIALKEAGTLLAKYNQKAKEQHDLLERVTDWFRFRLKMFKFVLHEEDIKVCVDSIASAKSSLHLAIAIAVLNRTQPESPTILQSISQMRDQVTSHFQQVKKSHTKNLRRIENVRLGLLEIENHGWRIGNMLPRSRKKNQRKALVEASSETSPPQELHAPAPDENPMHTIGEMISAGAFAENEASPFSPDCYDLPLIVWKDPSLDPEADSQHESSATSDDEALTPPSEESKEGFIEVTFSDGTMVELPPGLGRKPRLIEGSIEGPGDMLDAVEGPSDLALWRSSSPQPLSDAQALVEFLIPDEETTETAIDLRLVPSGTITLNCGYLTVLPQPESGSQLGFNDLETNPHDLGFLCIKRISVADDSPTPDMFDVLDLVHLCEQPCHHAKVWMLNDVMSLETLGVCVVIMIQSSDSAHPSAVNIFQHTRLAVYEKCRHACMHTQVQTSSTSTKCIPQLCLYAWCTEAPSQSEESEEESDESGSGSEEEEDDESDEDDEDEDDEDRLGPFRSVPCLHCHKTAWDPREVTLREPENAIIRHGTHSYGYRCRRCNRVSWISGTQQSFREVVVKSTQPTMNTVRSADGGCCVQ